MREIVGVAIAIVILGVGLGLLERFQRTRPGPAWYRRKDAPTDLAWFLSTPILTRVITRFALVVTAVLVLVVSGRSLAAGVASNTPARTRIAGAPGGRPLIRPAPLSS